ncbi:unnamed protein product [Paramecium primaurelia]|uniref:Uncharacterized protein n=1 Tax=Paramecium primaurelia TaxID=5886 RepID=A0A8S1K7J8_PARPR|nr:unnamed protein product [Paramecium primaurelia]
MMLLFGTLLVKKDLNLLLNHQLNSLNSLICQDLSEPLSFDSVASWIQFLKPEGPQYLKIIIVGTKKDLKSSIYIRRIQINIQFLESKFFKMNFQLFNFLKL